MRSYARAPGDRSYCPHSNSAPHEATVRTVTLLLTLCLSLTLSLLLTPPLPYASPYSQLLALGDGSAKVNQKLISHQVMEAHATARSEIAAAEASRDAADRRATAAAAHVSELEDLVQSQAREMRSQLSTAATSREEAEARAASAEAAEASQREAFESEISRLRDELELSAAQAAVVVAVHPVVVAVHPVVVAQLVAAEKMRADAEAAARAASDRLRSYETSGAYAAGALHAACDDLDATAQALIRTCMMK